jgi:feruloyl-CoA synthase
VIHVDGALPDTDSLRWQDLLGTPVGPAVAQAVQRLNHDTVAKYLFTSGSTGAPKAVTITQGMMCAAHAMAHQMIDSRAESHDRVLLEWLPWSHVAGGTAIFNSVLEDGATLYLDDGRPMPGAFDETLRNLQEVQPFRLGNMPIGYTMLLQALERDEAFGRKLFSKLLRLTSMGARLPDEVYNGIQAQAIQHTGYRLPFTSAYGSTETTAAVSCVYWPTERAGLVGLPHPGVELKLVPTDDGRHEVRVRSPSVTPGYLKQPELTALAFDEEGYLRMGDAVTFVDPADAREGLAFAGRLAEEFKLSSGVFVRVGSLRVDCVSALSPWVSDVVVAGADHDEIGLLAWLHVPVCCERFGMPGATPEQLAALPQLRDALHGALQAHNAHHPGSSTAVRRLLVLRQPPSMDIGEVNDKGYVNQRLVLQRRHAEVARLFAPQPDRDVIVMD